MGGVQFKVGVGSVRTSNIGSLLASSLAAYEAGTQVMIFYDNATCQGIIVANDGYSGQCP